MKPYWSSDDGRLSLHLGDCREVLPDLDIQADLIVADPPYGETSLPWDRWPDGWVGGAASAARSMWCFGSMRMFLERNHEFAQWKWKLSQDVVWEKHNGSSPVADRLKRVHELAIHWYQGRWSEVHHTVPRVPATFDARGRKTSTPSGSNRVAHAGAIGVRTYTDDGLRLCRSVIPARSSHRAAIHPTEKPVTLLLPLISYGCPPAGLVVDPFAGSCSTLAAAHQLGMRGVGVEADEQYAEAGARRLEAQLAQPSLFAAGPEVEEVAG